MKPLRSSAVVATVPLPGLPAVAPEAPTVEALPPSPGRLMWRAAGRHGGLLAGAILIALTLAAALLAPWIATQDPYAQDLGQRLIGPVWAANGSWAHPFGTDALGRDLWSRLVFGARVSLLVGFGAALISAAVGVVLGMLGGYFRGWVDSVVLFLINVKLALPPLLVGLCVIAVVGGSITALVMVLGFLFWDRFAVVTRALTLQLRGSEFITAAHVAGASNLRILASELLPNLLSQILVILTLDMSLAISVEAVLSFLGLGVRPPEPSWGLMIAEGRSLMIFKPYLVMVPGAALFALVVGINLFGDGLRDIATPHRKS